MKIIILFFYLFITSNILAQEQVILTGKSIDVLLEKLKETKKRYGKKSIEYAKIYIELALTYEQQGDLKNAELNILNADKVMIVLRDKLVITANAPKHHPRLVYPLSLQVLKIKCDVYTKQNQIEKVSNTMYLTKWIDFGFRIKDKEFTYHILRIIAKYFGSNSPLFKQKLSIFTDVEMHRKLDRETVYLLQEELTKKEFGAYKAPHIDALYDLAKFYFWEDDNKKYREYRAVVLESRANAFKENPDFYIMPRFPGCEETEDSHRDKKNCAEINLLTYMYENFKYPKQAIDNKTEGTVVIKFTISKSGKIVNPVIVKDIGDGCGREALRIINKMNSLPQSWTPAIQDLTIVETEYNLPIQFYIKTVYK